MKKHLTIIIQILAIVLILIFFLHKIIEQSKKQTEELLITNFSNFKVEERIVRGKSMTGIINEGTIVKIIIDYYKKNEIQRGDIIAYSFFENQEPIVKIVKGVPGDKFDILNDKGKWYLLINSKIVKNSDGIPYILNEKAVKILSLYIKNYKGFIPQDTYLILGNLPNGSMDSTEFGLIHRQDIIGKVLYKQNVIIENKKLE